MLTDFPRILSQLRHEKRLSQRQTASALGISQGLLSHYENGSREPGLAFVDRACTYYGVTADYLLGRTLLRDGTVISAEELYDAEREKDNKLRGSVAAIFAKKLIINSISEIFNLLSQVNSRALTTAYYDYLSTVIYKLFRNLYSASAQKGDSFFSTPAAFYEALLSSDLHRTDAKITALISGIRCGLNPDGEQPDIPAWTDEVLSREQERLHQSLLRVIHETGQRLDDFSK